MRSKTSKTFAWIIVLILVIGLAGFGIQDVLRSSGKNEVASFGNQKISSDDYVRMIQQEIRSVSEQFGTSLTFSQAQSLGVTQRALQKLISGAILDQTVEDLALSRSDEALENAIKNNSSFLDLAGRFSSEKYREVLLNINLQPTEYEEILRKELSRELLLRLTTTKPKIDFELQNLIANYYLEERVADAIILKKSDVPEALIKVTDEEIRSFYERSEELFTQPETKRISYVYLSPDDIADSQNVSEMEIRETYEAEKQFLNVPEKRSIDQMFFDDADSAISALSSKSSKLRSFENIMLTRGLDKADVSLGDIVASDLPSSVQEAVFSADVNSVIGPLETDLGFAIYRVNNVAPAVVTSFDAEYNAIKDKIALKKATEELGQILNFANDEIAGGLTIEDIAKTTKMNSGSLDFYAGADLPNFASTPSFKAMISSAKSYASDVTFNEDGGIFSLRIDKTIEPFIKDYISVKELAKSRVFAKKVLIKLNENAEKILKNQKLQGGSLLSLADIEQYKLIENKKYTRFERAQELPPDFSKRLFSMKENDVEIILGGEQVFIVQLKNVFSGEIDSDDGKNLIQQINSQFTNSLDQDIFSALINGLEKGHDLFISQKAVDTAISRFN